MYAIVNGKLVRHETVHIEFSDLSIHRGYGIFDFMRVIDGKVLWIEDYLDRLMNSINKAGLQHSLTRAEYKQKIISLAEVNGYRNSSIKVLVTGGDSLDYSSVNQPANYFIINRPFVPMDPSLYSHGAKLISHRYRREYPQIKSTNYFTAMKLYPEMKAAQAVEILYGDQWVTECSRSNVFFVKNGQLLTPRQDILHGITRKTVMTLFSVGEEDISFDSILAYDEVFITSTVKEVLPVTMIDGKAIGNGLVGPVTKQVMEGYQAHKEDLLRFHITD